MSRLVEENVLLQYVSEIEYIVKPNNPGQKYSIKEMIPDLKRNIALLYLVIDDPETDATIERLDSDFYVHLEKIISAVNLNELPIAIEGLAQKYEAFIKKIAFFKYGGSELWAGNSVSAGISKTTFMKLCEGVIANKYGIETEVPEIRLPEPLVNYTGYTRAFLDFARDKLRNAVHNAPTMLRKELVPYSEVAIIIYLLTIESNKEFLSRKYLSSVQYEDKLLDVFGKWEKNYVISQVESVDSFFSEEVIPQVFETDWNAEEEFGQKREGSILDIYKEEPRLVIVGSPGLGKSTTLQYLCVDLIKNKQLQPYYIPLREYMSNVGLLKLISTVIGFSTPELETNLNEEKCALFLDGLNEVIIESERIILVNEIKHFLKAFPKTSFVLTTRPGRGEPQFAIPIFKLLPFTNEKIADFVNKNYPSIGESFVNSLTDNKRLCELCRNPLILKITCSTVIKENIPFPTNKGKLLRTFFDSIFNREFGKDQTFSIEKHRYIIIELGYETRKKRKVTFSADLALSIVSNACMVIDPELSSMDLIDKFVELGILVKNRSVLSFSHEMFQEYFAAEGLLKNSDYVSELKENISGWEEPILLYSGLIESPSAFILDLAEVSPSLSVDCAESFVLAEEILDINLQEKLYSYAVDIQNSQNSTEGLLGLIRYKRVDLVKKSVIANFDKYGRRSLANYAGITTLLFTNLHGKNFIETATIFLSLDQSFAASIVRGLGNQDSDEIERLSDSVKSNIGLFDLYTTKPSTILKLLRLIGIKKQEHIASINLKDYISYLIHNNYAEIAWQFILQFDLHKDEDYLLELFTRVSNDSEIRVEMMLFGIVNSEVSIFEQLGQIILKGTNLSLFLGGQIFARANTFGMDVLPKFRSDKRFSRILDGKFNACKSSKEVFKIEVSKAINCFAGDKFYSEWHGIIFKWVNCKFVRLHKKEEQWVVSVENTNVRGIIRLDQLRNEEVKKGDIKRLQVLKINKGNKTLTFSQLGNDNSKLVSLPEITLEKRFVELGHLVKANNLNKNVVIIEFAKSNKFKIVNEKTFVYSEMNNNVINSYSRGLAKLKQGKVLCEVKSIDNYFVFIKIDNELNGRIHISKVSNRYISDLRKLFKVGDTVLGDVLSWDSNYGFSISLVENNVKPSSDLGEKLNSALNKNSTENLE
jgi:predicted RNA-binding protein with RPS1 domain